jgi:hypothetical protein
LIQGIYKADIYINYNLGWDVVKMADKDGKEKLKKKG